MYLGIDLGTSGVKVVLMDREQNLLASNTQALTVSRPQHGWSEQDPAAWCQATSLALEALRQSHPSQLSAVRALSLSGQMHGATLLNASGEPVRPCMLWNDTRAAQQAQQLDANPLFRSITGNIVFAGFTAPKCLWVQQFEPAVWASTKRVLLPKDYLRYWLTGDYASDMSDASGTAWLDVAKRDWSDELLAATSIDRSYMPTLFEGTQITGTLKRELAQQWGMRHDVQVAAGAGDNAATAIGLGVLQSGDAFVSLGTSGVIFVASSSFTPNAASAVHTFCHAVPNTWHQMSVMLSATACLEWLSKLLAMSPAALIATLDEHATTPADLRFYPYLNGERTPYNDAKLRAAFVGLDAAHTAQTMTQAVLEGVAFGLRDNLAALSQSGKPIQRVLVAGGGARALYWLQMLANVLQVTIDIPASAEVGAALGAARLAMLADVGHTTDAATALPIASRAKVEQSLQPNAQAAQLYEAAYARWQQFIPCLRGDFL